ncbi:hypothetical protein EDD15DRAFT_2197397 [Pisolithus albus]|nr:hypothetical protein EDD15DRAFT_2197397 [Pisolithus albus]
MSEQQQCKVRFYHQVDIVLISPQHLSRTSLVQPKDMHSASSQGWTASKQCPSIEALSLYGDESPSPPAKMSAAVRCLSPSPHLSLFERMKGAEVPRPPSPPHDWVPTSQQDMEMDVRESLGETVVQSPLPIPDLSLYERMRHAQVPVPLSPPQEWVPPPKEDWEMEMAKSSGSKAVQSLTSPPSLSLFETMKHAKVLKPPSPPHDWVPPSFQVAEVDVQLPLPSVDVPAPHSPFKDLHIHQGEEPDHSCRIDFGDPDQGWLRDMFDTGMRGPIPTYDECQELVQAGLATVDTEDYGLEEMIEDVNNKNDRLKQALLGYARFDVLEHQDQILFRKWNPQTIQKAEIAGLVKSFQVNGLDRFNPTHAMPLIVLKSIVKLVLCMLQEFKLRYLENPPPAHYPYNQELDVHIVQVMQWMAADI